MENHSRLARSHALVPTLSGLRLQAAGLLLLATTLGGAQTETYDLTRRVRVGDTFRYSIKMAITESKTSGELKGTVEDVITRTRGKQIDMERRVKELTFRMGSDSATIPDFAVLRIAIKSTGETLEVKRDAEKVSELRSLNFGIVVVPDKPIGVGEKWTHTFVADSKMGTPASTANYEFLKTETVGDELAAVIAVTHQEDGGKNPLSSKSTVWISTKTGMYLRSHVDFVNLPMGSDGKLVNARVDLDRIK
ncbi:MAG: hypothetical protein JST40_00380 [Armatimonadetes bacterium]|nr:hypothetical protein [Armatimonadota bacterium]